MSMIVECENCHRRYGIDERAAGKRVKCSQCGSVFTARPASGPPAGTAAPSAGRRPPQMPVRPPIADESDDPFAAMASLEGGGGGGWLPAGPPEPPAPKSMYAGASAAAAVPAGDGGLAPVDPIAVAPRGGDRAARAPRPVRPNDSIGLDAATPWLLLAYLGGIVALIVLNLNRIPEEMHPEAAGFVKSRIWIYYVSMAASFLAIIAPLCLLGVFVASKVMRFEMPGVPYLKAAGVAAVPFLALLAVLFFELRGQPLQWVVLFAALPLAFYVLKYACGLLLSEALVAYGLGAVMFVGGWYVAQQVPPAVLESGVVKTKAQVDRAIAEDIQKNGPWDRRRQAKAGVGPNGGGGGGQSPEDAAAAAAASALQARVDALAGRNLDATGPDKLLVELAAVQKDLAAQKKEYPDRPEWAQQEKQLADLRAKAQAMPPVAPPADVFQPIPAGKAFDPLPAAAALAEEVSYGRFRFRPPADATLDLEAAAAAPPAAGAGATAAGPTLKYVLGRSAAPSSPVETSASLTVAAVPRANPKQQRPLVVTKAYQQAAAREQNLFWVEPAEKAPADRPTDPAAVEPAAVTYGSINGVPFARVVGRVGGEATGPLATASHWATTLYITPAGDNWLVARVAEGPTADAVGARAFESAVRTLRPAGPADKPADPLAPDRVASLFPANPRRVAELFRKDPVAAEPHVIRFLEHEDVMARRTAAELLPVVATAKSVPQLLPMVQSTDAAVSSAARAALRRLAPEQFDVAAEALADLRSGDPVKKDKAFAALAAAAPPADPKRRNDVATLLEDYLLAERGGFDAQKAAKALAAWSGDRTALRLTPALNNFEAVRLNTLRRDALILALSGTRDELAAATILKWAGVAPEPVADALIRMGPVAEKETIKTLYANQASRTPANAVQAAEVRAARTALVRVLREVGTTRSLDVLARCAGDRRDPVFAATAKEAVEQVRARAAAAPKPGAGAAAAPATRGT